jgi:hypothetical protein
MEKSIKKVQKNLHISLIIITFTSEFRDDNGWNWKRIRTEN